MTALPLAGVRVLECADGIAGAYCGKMLRDAGAHIVKLEADAVPDRDSPLFEFLAAGKESVVSGGEILALGADIVIVDGAAGWDLRRARELLADGASTVIVGISPFGSEGPYVDADILANEFILQALCGSIDGRGLPGEEPLQAGGSIGEWVAGSYAACAAAAGLRRLRRTGHGDVFDLSVYEAMAVTMGGMSAVAFSVLGDGVQLPGRSLELPSIVPTADGLVGFCTVTAQQFADFLVLIGRPDLLDDAELSSFAGRVRRRDEFLEMVHEWAATRTTAEIVGLAADLRIPVAPVGTPETVVGIDHFRERGVFVTNAHGHLQPRVPYRADAFASLAPGRVPELGEHTGQVHWPIREMRRDAEAVARPLAGVTVADFTAFWAGPTASQILAALGADVVKIEGLSRPDGMRFSGGRPPSVDQWWETGPAFLSSNNDKRGLTVELGTPQGRAVVRRVIARSDVLVENFSPRVMANFALEWPEVAAINPAVCMVRMPAFGLDGPWRDRVGFAQTMEQASGMAWLTGRADGPPVIPRGVCDPIAGLHAAFATIIALEHRDATGDGVHVEATMVEAALNVAARAVLEQTVRGVTLHRDGNRGPDAAPQGVYPARGNDTWVAVSVTDDTQWPALARLIGCPHLVGDPSVADEPGRRARAAELDKLIATWTSTRDADDAVAALRAAGIPSARVRPARELLTDPQLAARGFWEPVHHPVVGSFRTTGLPFRSVTAPDGWVRDGAPLFGRHNHEVLRELGYTDAEITTLEADGVIGSRPAGL